MTEAEREELIKKMAKAAWPSDAAVIWGECPILLRQKYLNNARAALAVAESVIREECARIVEKGNYETRWTESERAIAAAIREGGKDDD